MKTTLGFMLASLLGSSALAGNAPIGPDFVAAAPRLHIDRDLVASSAMNRIEPLDVIAFSRASNQLREDALVQIDTTAKWLRRHATHHIVLEGHTDRAGDADYNEDLATRRMAAVRDRLIANGISGDRILLITFGEREATDPENPNDRRVVMFVTREVPSVVVATQLAHRDVIIATWSDRNVRMQIEPSRSPVQVGKSAISRR